MKTLKKHKYKFLFALVLFIALGGGAVYYFKQKEAAKKAKMEGEPKEEEVKATEQPKEPAVAETPKETPKEKQVAQVQKDLVLNTKGNLQLAAKA